MTTPDVHRWPVAPDMLVVVGVTTAAGLAAALHAPVGLRLPVGLLFLLLAPGAGWVRALRLASPQHELALVVALSLALDVLASQATVMIGLFSTSSALAVLGTASVAGVGVCQLVRAGARS